MNQRDRLYVQREWLAWASWMRQGKTFPNALGYKSGTVEYALMRGETGGDIHAGSKVPDRFDCDRNVEILNKVFWNLPENTKNAISGVYLYRMQERRIALIIDVTRHKIRRWLNDGYHAGYEALTGNSTRNK